MDADVPRPNGAPSTATSGRKEGRRLGLAMPMAGGNAGAAQGHGHGTDEGAALRDNAGGGQQRSMAGKKPPRNPSMAGKKRKATAPPSDAPPTSPTPFSQAAQHVLDEIPTSVDDETFLSYMDMSQSLGGDMSPPLGEEETFGSPEINEDCSDSEVEADVEMEVPKRKGSRGSNFTVLEDECLVRAWQAIGLDSVAGVDQSSSTYWSRIYEHFHWNNKSGIFLTQVSVSRRWSFIRMCCTRWSHCLAQVERLNPSGANGQDKVNIAQRLYKGKPKKKGDKAGMKAFVLQHCWELRQYDEKWRVRNEEIPTKGKKTSNCCSPIDGDHVEVSSDDDATPISVPSNKRPLGRKAAKDKLKKVGENTYKESFDNMITSRKEIAASRNEFKNARWMEMKELEERKAAAEERRAAAEERRVAIEESKLAADEAAKRLEHEQRFMFMDKSNLDEKAKTYLETMCD